MAVKPTNPSRAFLLHSGLRWPEAASAGCTTVTSMFDRFGIDYCTDIF
ncbi:hypothetical protein MES4922_190005 [Mesorhizobium ventifaucium]|uniref:Uncharacterized protein n=1 Tax=Mesorhizobium ventifaucium TaxID=666020 RepID=A0ABN8JJH6_9HYPH|nr:hypothetical protein MES4922_190005 [Mesorhizobium ventifaucium]